MQLTINKTLPVYIDRHPYLYRISRVSDDNYRCRLFDLYNDKSPLLPDNNYCCQSQLQRQQIKQFIATHDIETINYRDAYAMVLELDIVYKTMPDQWYMDKSVMIHDFLMSLKHYLPNEQTTPTDDWLGGNNHAIDFK